MMSSCMTSLNSHQSWYNVNLELGKLLHIYAACFALSLVKLCSIPYKSHVLLLKTKITYTL
jgi:hypothetical protein